MKTFLFELSHHSEREHHHEREREREIYSRGPPNTCFKGHPFTELGVTRAVGQTLRAMSDIYLETSALHLL